MDAVLPNGKLKVVGVIENVSWRERHEAQKRARAERMNDPAFRAKYEARKKAKEDAANEAAAAAKAKAEERVRKKVIAETYKQLGLEEDYIETQKAWIAEQEAKNRYGTDGVSAADHLKRSQAIAAGAGRAAGADGRERRGAVLDFIGDAVGEGSFSGLLKKGGVLGGTAIGAAVGGPIGAAVGAVIGGLTISVPMAILKVTRKGKMQDGNLANQAERLEMFKAELAEFETKVNNLMAKIEADAPMLNEKYGSMKKGAFNEFLSSYISSALVEFGLTAGDIKKVADSVAKTAEQNEAEQPQQNAEEPTEEESEKEVEEPAVEQVTKEEVQENKSEEQAVEAARRQAEEERKKAEQQEQEEQGQLGE